MKPKPFNGWENKFTYLIDKCLSNEANLYDEVMELMANESNNSSAGRRLKIWVETSLAHWLMSLPGRSKKHDEAMRLLVWDLVASAFACTDWNNLVRMLVAEEEMGYNPFTFTLYETIMINQQLEQNVMLLIKGASSINASIDAVKQWFEAQLETWIKTPTARHHWNSPMSMLARDLIEDTYTVINWELVARAFRGAS